MDNANALLVIPRLRVQNANAISGPLTWGFPSPAAFTGFAHALERRLNDEYLTFGGVGIICHQFEPQVARSGHGHQVFRLTRNPLDKQGGTASLVEEGRTHLEVSLIIEIRYDYDEEAELEQLAESILPVVQGMRLAGGSILPPQQTRFHPHCIRWFSSEQDNLDAFRKLRRSLLPGFALVHREDRLASHQQEMQSNRPETSLLDALLDLSRLNFEPDLPDPDHPDQIQWGIRRKPGWLVPIPVGYAALSPTYPAGEVANARDETTPFCFVESLYSLGEWVSPHRINRLKQLLWYHHADSEHGIYRCINRYSEAPIEVTTSNS